MIILRKWKSNQVRHRILQVGSESFILPTVSYLFYFESKNPLLYLIKTLQFLLKGKATWMTHAGQALVTAQLILWDLRDSEDQIYKAFSVSESKVTGPENLYTSAT